MDLSTINKDISSKSKPKSTKSNKGESKDRTPTPSSKAAPPIDVANISSQDLAAMIAREATANQRPRPMRIRDYWNDVDFELRRSIPEEVQMLRR
jgi:hypothetical protein